MADIADAAVRAHSRSAGVVDWHWKWPVPISSVQALVGRVVDAALG